MPCGWKSRGRKCGAEPTVGIRDLGPTYGKLRVQPVCKLHSTYADNTRRMQKLMPHDDTDRDG